MNIQAEKLKLIELLLLTDSPSVIQRIKNVFLSVKDGDIWENLSDAQKKDIDNALDEVANGNFINYSDFISKHK